MLVVRGGRGSTAPASDAPVTASIDKPKLSKAAGAVWDELSQRALEAGTLAPRTVGEFVDLCHLKVQLDRTLEKIEKAEVGSDDWARLMRVYPTLTQRLEGKRRAFRLAPMGRPIEAETGKAKSALEQLLEKRKGLHAAK